MDGDNDHIAPSSIALHDLLVAYHAAPTAENAALVAQEVYRGEAELFAAVRKRVTSRELLKGEDLITMNVQGLGPVPFIQAALTVDKVVAQDRFSVVDGEYLILFRARDFLRACDEAHIVMIILDHGRPTETGLGKIGGSTSFAVIDQAVWKSISHPHKNTSLTPREERMGRMRAQPGDTTMG